MATNTLSSTPWVDSKRFMWLLSPLVPLIALASLLAALASGHLVFAWGTIVLLHVVIPIADVLFGADTSNPPESAVNGLENDRYYRAIVFAYIPMQYVVTVLAVWMAITLNPTWYEFLGLVFAAGAVNGIGINTAHELGHKKENLERWLSKVTLAPVAYGHFYIEHNKGHHKNVATPEDPASSKMGQTFWEFLPQSMIGSLRSAWDIEKERLHRLNKGPWTLENENIQAWLMTVALFGGLTLWLGWVALPFLLLQAFYGASLLEVINYLEHYGLLRHKGADGRVERCRPEHSWNSNHVVTNLFLYQLQRHSDHHANPTRRYQALRHFDDSPQLPSGYASMILAAYVPFVWFRWMDPLVAAHFKGDMSRANIVARKRERLFARWHTAKTPVAAPAVATPSFTPSAATAANLVQTQRYQCCECGYIYDERIGCPQEGFPAGTAWSALPANWPCPDCTVREKVDFVPVAS